MLYYSSKCGAYSRVVAMIPRHVSIVLLNPELVEIGTVSIRPKWLGLVLFVVASVDSSVKFAIVEVCCEGPQRQ
jgi:hypothetical protein